MGLREIGLGGGYTWKQWLSLGLREIVSIGSLTYKGIHVFRNNNRDWDWEKWSAFGKSGQLLEVMNARGYTLLLTKASGAKGKSHLEFSSGIHYPYNP